MDQTPKIGKDSQKFQKTRLAVLDILGLIQMITNPINTFLDIWLPLSDLLHTFVKSRLRESNSTPTLYEVTHQPTYGSEGVLCSSGLLSEDCGALRVGGSGKPGHHQWFFAEFVVLSGGRNVFDEGRMKTEHAILRLLKLGWKRSASVLVIVAGSLGDEQGEWSKNLDQIPAWNRPLLLPPLMLNLPTGGVLVAKAFDIKRNPDDTLISVT